MTSFWQKPAARTSTSFARKCSQVRKHFSESDSYSCTRICLISTSVACDDTSHRLPCAFADVSICCCLRRGARARMFAPTQGETVGGVPQGGAASQHHADAGTSIASKPISCLHQVMTSFVGAVGCYGTRMKASACQKRVATPAGAPHFDDIAGACLCCRMCGCGRSCASCAPRRSPPIAALSSQVHMFFVAGSYSPPYQPGCNTRQGTC